MADSPLRILAMIPARMGSQRLKQKNLRELDGVPLITRAIRKCKAADCFSEIWVNSEHETFGEIARVEGAGFHARPAELADNQATSEQFVAEFLRAHPCDFVVQVHSIAPLLTVEDIRSFVERVRRNEADCLLSCEPIQIECLHRGRPVNFTFAEKTNSQDLEPVLRVCWSITAWRSATYLAAAAEGRCATYAGRVGTVQLGRWASHVIKTEEDLLLAQILHKLEQA